jgi:16S rRNA (guanine527-N7)-methyltransferase
VNKIDKYIELLEKWNKVHSLTSYDKKELKNQIQITIKGIEYLPKNIKIALDIGTGAGIPGLVLAMHMPDVLWYLVEPLQKRYSFLNYVKLKLGLNNVKVLPKRLENVEPFGVELITSRAVKDAKFLIELSNKFITPNTIMLLYKGENAKNEIFDVQATKEIKKFGKINYVILKDIKQC